MVIRINNRVKLLVPKRSGVFYLEMGAIGTVVQVNHEDFDYVVDFGAAWLGCNEGEILNLDESCPHQSFDCSCTVNRLEDTGQFNMDVKVKCNHCGVEFVFLGLPVGLNLGGATCNVDGTEGRFAIAPKGSVLLPLGDKVQGFSIKAVK